MGFTVGWWSEKKNTILLIFWLPTNTVVLYLGLTLFPQKWIYNLPVFSRLVGKGKESEVFSIQHLDLYFIHQPQCDISLSSCAQNPWVVSLSDSSSQEMNLVSEGILKRQYQGSWKLRRGAGGLANLMSYVHSPLRLLPYMSWLQDGNQPTSVLSHLLMKMVAFSGLLSQ